MNEDPSKTEYERGVADERKNWHARMKKLTACITERDSALHEKLIQSDAVAYIGQGIIFGLREARDVLERG